MGAMAVEEKRLMKIQASRCDTQLLDLQLEYEDIELDIDDVAMCEQEEFELLRRLEIQHAEVRAESSWIARVRHERMRWKARKQDYGRFVCDGTAKKRACSIVYAFSI